MLLAAQLSAQTASVPEPNTIELPPFIVAESANAPHWLYVEIPGCEILSSCSERITRQFATSYSLLWQTLRTILPEDLTLQSAVPQIVILMEENQVVQAQEAVATELLRKETSRQLQQAISDNLDQTVRTALSEVTGRRAQAPLPPAVTDRELRFLPNLRLWDSGSSAVFTVVREREFDAHALTFAIDHIRFLLERRTPPLPRWFIDGFMHLYESGALHRHAMTLPRFVWLTEEESVRLRKSSKQEISEVDPLPPLSVLFTSRPAVEDETGTQQQAEKRLLAALFIRWALDPTKQARKAALWKLVDRAGKERITEEVFGEYFGLKHRELNQPLVKYLMEPYGAFDRSLRIPRDSRMRSPRVAIRNAAPAEIGRIQGEWERMTASYVESHHPEFTEQYLAQARRTLTKTYHQGEHAPQLLASLGLLERDSGNEAAAREFLRAAVDANVIRPRAYVELVRLRLEQRFDSTSAITQKLSIPETTELLRLLFAAREQAPPLSETYRAIATVWTHAETVPTRAQLAVLDEGVHLFRTDSHLIYDAAALYAQHGFTREAMALANLGLHVANDRSLEERFTALKAQLGDAGSVVEAK